MIINRELWEVMCCTYGLCPLMGGQPHFPLKCLWLRSPVFAHYFWVLNWINFLNMHDRLDAGSNKWTVRLQSRRASVVCAHSETLKSPFLPSIMGKLSQSHKQSAGSGGIRRQSASCSDTQCQCGLGQCPLPPWALAIAFVKWVQ